MKKRTHKPSSRSGARSEPRSQDLQELAESRVHLICQEVSRVPRFKRIFGRGVPQAFVRIVNAQTMIQLNHHYRGKDYATDVLSFTAPEPFQRLGQLGELVICLPTLRKQAKEQGHPVGHELEVLLVHGVLHLLGLDHELGPKEAALMARWEEKILRGLSRSTQRRGLIRRSSSV